MKLKYNLLVLISLLFTLTSFSKEIKYKVSDIPKELLNNSKAIVRHEHIVFKISSPKKAMKKVTYAITILNNNGINNSYLMQHYDRFSKIKIFNAKVYDKNGNLIKKIKSSDFLDYSAISGFSLYDDSRALLIDPECRTLPFTVEYSYEIFYNGILNYPVWYANHNFNIAVESSKFEVIVPLNHKFRHLERNLKKTYQKSVQKESISYLWSVKNLKSVIKEDYGQHFSFHTPTVFTAPSEFEMGGVRGNFDSWQNFGKWIYNLNEGRDSLSKEKVAEIQELVENERSTENKIKILYDYLQNKTRYVSIQIGIGGWQPFDAKIIDKYSYGDCKGLSNYMKALLNAAGIKSYYTLIKAGVAKPYFIPDFPFNQFNHAILCVPMQRDTVWLECTSQQLPYGYNGSFTDDREALLITDSGGKLIKTPRYTDLDNIKETFSSVNLGEAESKANIKTKYCGLFYDEMTTYLRLENLEKRKFIMRNISIQNFELLEYNHNELRSIKPYIDLNLTVSIKEYTANLGNRLLVPLNLLNKIKNVPAQILSRKSDILINRSKQIIDTVVYKLPKSYKIYHVPKNMDIKTKFGMFRMNITKSDNQITYMRQLIINKGTYPAAEYDAFTDFFEMIVAADNLKFVLTRN